MTSQPGTCDTRQCVQPPCVWQASSRLPERHDVGVVLMQRGVAPPQPPCFLGTRWRGFWGLKDSASS